MTTRQLVATLGHRNAWWRETAQRLLVERQAVDAEPDLRAAAFAKASAPKAGQ